jgi:hypothetical protein
MFVLKRSRDTVLDVSKMQDKLLMRPDLAPVVDWCMAWILAARRQCEIPTFENMKLAWKSEQAKDPTNQFFNGPIHPKYACEQCAVHWSCYMEYEKTLNAAQGGPGVEFGAAAAAAAAAARPPPPPPPPPLLPPPVFTAAVSVRGGTSPASVASAETAAAAAERNGIDGGAPAAADAASAAASYSVSRAYCCTVAHGSSRGGSRQRKISYVVFGYMEASY